MIIPWIAVGAAVVIGLLAVTRAARRSSSLRLGTDDSDEVRIGATCPRSVEPGKGFCVRFAAYAPAFSDHVAHLLDAQAAGSTAMMDVERTRWAIGIDVLIRWVGDSVTVMEPESRFTWDGRFKIIPFEAKLRPGVVAGPVVVGFDILVSDICLTRIRLDLAVAGPGRAAMGPARRADGVAASTAFISYASKDRDRVVDRVSELQNSIGLDCFLDCLDIRPGRRWKVELAVRIPVLDLFLLYWSPSAKSSPNVEWEWKTRLEARGLDSISIRALESPERSPAPPPELSDLHFGDPMMRARPSSSP